VNVIAPGNIATAINAAFDTESIVGKIQPLQRFGTPADVANAAVYLASERSAQVTGLVLPVDGGTSTGPPPLPTSEVMRRPPPGDRWRAGTLAGLRGPPDSFRSPAASTHQSVECERSSAVNTPPIVSPEEWETARQQLLVKEKEVTRAKDALAAERRRMPWL